MADLTFSATTPAETVAIESGAFWPVIDIADVRAATGADGTVTSARLQFAVSEAVIVVNRQLKRYREDAEKQGIETLAETGSEKMNGISVNINRYFRAVCSYTKAELLENYADYDATGKTAERAEAKLQQAALFRRDGHAAIADITGNLRADSELI